MTQNILLSGPERAPRSGGKAKSIVVLMHGLGADGNDLIGLAPMMAEHLPDTHFISPNAPYPCDMAPMGHQWFSLRDWSPAAMLRGADQVAPVVHRFADDLLERLSLPEEKLAWVGFSQGTMTALHVALQRQHNCAGVVGFSGALVTQSITSKPPVCLIHGEQDMVVPFQAMGIAERILRGAGVLVETHRRPQLGHGIDPEGLDAAIAFLKTRL